MEAAAAAGADVAAGAAGKHMEVGYSAKVADFGFPLDCEVVPAAVEAVCKHLEAVEVCSHETGHFAADSADFGVAAVVAVFELAVPTQIEYPVSQLDQNCQVFFSHQLAQPLFSGLLIRSLPL